MHAPLGMKHNQSTIFSTLHLLLCLLHLSAPHTYPGGERANNVLLGPRQGAATNETETILSSHSPLAELNAAISVFGSGSKCFLLLVKLLSRPWKHRETLSVEWVLDEWFTGTLSQGIFTNKPPSPSADPDTSKTIPTWDKIHHIEHSVSQIINEIHTHTYIKKNVYIYIYRYIRTSIQCIDIRTCVLCISHKPRSYHNYRRFLLLQAMSKKQKHVNVIVWPPAFKCFMILSPTTCHWHLLNHQIAENIQAAKQQHSHKKTCITSHQDSIASFLFSHQY